MASGYTQCYASAHCSKTICSLERVYMLIKCHRLFWSMCLPIHLNSQLPVASAFCFLSKAISVDINMGMLN